MGKKFVLMGACSISIPLPSTDLPLVGGDLREIIAPISLNASEAFCGERRRWASTLQVFGHLRYGAVGYFGYIPDGCSPDSDQ